MESNDLKLKSSPVLCVLRITLAVCMIAAVICMFLAVNGFDGISISKGGGGGTPQLPLSSHKLYGDALEFAERIIDDPTEICSWNQVQSISVLKKASNSERSGKIVQICTKSGSKICYESQKQGYYVLVPDDSYYMAINTPGVNVTSTLEISGEDLNALYEEAMS